MGSKGRGIKVKVAVYGRVGGKPWVCARRAEHIESKDFLGDETVPVLGWEVRVTRGESSAKVILECANRTFGGVAEMGIWGDKLEVDILFAEGALHSTGEFVVKDVESGICKVLLEMFVASYPGVSDFQGLSVLQKVGVD